MRRKEERWKKTRKLNKGGKLGRQEGKETREERTFDEGLGVAMTELTNQIVEPTGKTRLTASLLLGVWMETLERSLRRRGHKERRRGHKERRRGHKERRRGHKERRRGHKERR